MEFNVYVTGRQRTETTLRKKIEEAARERRETIIHLVGESLDTPFDERRPPHFYIGNDPALALGWSEKRVYFFVECEDLLFVESAPIAPQFLLPGDTSSR